MNLLQNKARSAFGDRLAAGLSRKAIKRCSAWAEKYRIIGGEPWSFKYHPFLREIMDADARYVAAQKAAQMGVTEAGMNRAFFKLDIQKRSHLYLLPSSKPDAYDFSSTRFDPALEESEHLDKMFSDTKNIGVKRAGSACLYIRGTRSRSHIKSIPVADVTIDEVDEHNQDNLAMVDERMSGQIEKSTFELSTPTVDGHGINKSFTNSTQDHYFFKSPFTDRYIELDHDCLVITSDDPNDPAIFNSYVKCPITGRKINHDTKLQQMLETGKYVSKYPGRIRRGFHISQLYSYTINPGEIAIKYLLGLTNPADEQEYFNSKMGLTHAVKGARITDEDIQASMGTHTIKTSRPVNATLITMGVDVGKKLHCWVDRWYIKESQIIDINAASTCSTLNMVTLNNFEELDTLMAYYGVDYCVIDANPETRKAEEFVKRHYGRASTCYFSNGAKGKEISAKEYSVSVDRTTWLDTALGRFRSRGRIYLPLDTSMEVKTQLKRPTKIYSKDKDGNIVAKYVSSDDHFAFSRCYSEIALPLAVDITPNKDHHG